MMASGSARQTNGFRFSLCSATKRLMAACSSTTEQKTPCFRRRRESVAKKPSTAFSHDADVGVKWNVQRGCRSSQARTLACLWAAFGGPTLHRRVAPSALSYGFERFPV